MFNVEKLKDFFILYTLFYFTILTVATFSGYKVDSVFFVAFVLLFVLHRSVISNTITINVKGNLETKEVSSLLRNSKELDQATKYALSLDSDDFVRFVRLVVELRDSKSQEALKELRK